MLAAFSHHADVLKFMSKNFLAKDIKSNIVFHQANQSAILSITKTAPKLLSQTIYGYQHKRKSKKNQLKIKLKTQKIIQHTRASYFKYAKRGETHAQHQMNLN